MSVLSKKELKNNKKKYVFIYDEEDPDHPWNGLTLTQFIVGMFLTGVAIGLFILILSIISDL